jgi:hypothetical protein
MTGRGKEYTFRSSKKKNILKNILALDIEPSTAKS